MTTPVRRHASEETLLTPQPKRLRSQTILFDKNKCIICQKDGGKLHKVAFSATGQKFLDIAKQLPDQTLFIRLNSVPDASDAVANDVQYHLTCWVLAQRDAHKNTPSKNGEIQEMDDLDRVLADIEIINVVRYQLNSPGKQGFMHMNNINTTYDNLLGVPVDPHNRT